MKAISFAVITMITTCCALHELQAQTTTAVAGGDAKSSKGTVSYTVGQSVYSSQSSTRGSVSEGVQQPFTFNVIAGESEKDINLISAYPNPASTALTLRIVTESFAGYACELLDVGGRLVHSQNVEQEYSPLPIDRLASGAFVLRVSKQGAVIKSFQIIKKQ